MKRLHTLMALAAGFIIGAMAYWFQPYNESTILGVNMYVIMAAGSVLSALASSSFCKKSPLPPPCM